MILCNEVKWLVQDLREVEYAVLRFENALTSRRYSWFVTLHDWLYIKISPMKDIMRINKKEKLIAHFVGPYQILICVGKVAYELYLLNKFASLHPFFHVSMLKMRDRDMTSIALLEGLDLMRVFLMRKYRLRF